MTLTKAIVLRVTTLAFLEVMPIHMPNQARAATLANVESVEAADVVRAAKALHRAGTAVPQIVR